MIELYYFPSPNTWKVSIALEELSIAYQVKPVDIRTGVQKEPWFLALSPNGRVPAVRDTETGETVFESGAILVWLAERTGKLLPASGASRTQVFEWLFWQMGGLGPMAGQSHHFRRYAAEGNDYAVQRYEKECARLYGVLDARLRGRRFIADEYSIADIACWGWVWFRGMHGISLEAFPEVQRWYDEVGARPAVQRGRRVGMEMIEPDVRPLFEGASYQVPVDFVAEKTRV